MYLAPSPNSRACAVASRMSWAKSLSLGFPLLARGTGNRVASANAHSRFLMGPLGGWPTFGSISPITTLPFSCALRVSVSSLSDCFDPQGGSGLVRLEAYMGAVGHQLFRCGIS